MNKLKHLILFLLLFAVFHTMAQTTAHERACDIDKGYNLAAWLEAGWLGDNYPNPTEYTADDLRLFSRLGFKTIRVPVLFEWIIDENPPYNTIVDQDPFDIIQNVIIPIADECEQTVILVNHHGRDLNDSNYASELPRIVAQWEFLAQYYANLPHDRYFFELRNEPTNAISNENLGIVQQAIIDAIRAIDSDRTLIVGANWWNAPWSLAETIPYNDPQNNTIYTFHSYAPFDFTHQGLFWAYQYFPPPISFSAADANDFRNSMIAVKNWSITNNAPIFWGEFGVSWHAPPVERCNYIDFVINIVDSLNIPYTYWDIKHNDQAFGIFENGVMHQDNLVDCFADAMGLEYNTNCANHEDLSCATDPNPCEIIINEHIINGTFNNNLDNWYWWNCTPSSHFSTNYIGGIGLVNQPWEAGFSQAGITYEQGVTYEITFEAYAPVPRNIWIKAGLSVTPFDTYHYEEILLTSSSQNFTIQFTMNAPSVTNGSFEFYLGDVDNQQVDVILDNVSMISTTYDCPEDCPPTLDLTGKLSNSLYQAFDQITSDAEVISNTGVNFHAGQRISLQSNFTTTQNTSFKAAIKPCGSSIE